MIQKNRENGFTLVSLAIYITLIIIVIGILATINGAYKTEVKEFTSDITGISEYDKFNLYFIREVKKTNNKIVDSSSSFIKFSANNINFYKYEYKNGGIYLTESKLENNVENTVTSIKLAEVENCTFTIGYQNKIIIEVTAQIGAQMKQASYTLNYFNDTSIYQSETSFKYLTGE